MISYYFLLCPVIPYYFLPFHIIYYDFVVFLVISCHFMLIPIISCFSMHTCAPVTSRHHSGLVTRNSKKGKARKGKEQEEKTRKSKENQRKAKNSKEQQGFYDWHTLKQSIYRIRCDHARMTLAPRNPHGYPNLCFKKYWNRKVGFFCSMRACAPVTSRHHSTLVTIRKTKEILIILVFFGTRMKQDYQDDSSFSSWYPIKTALCDPRCMSKIGIDSDSFLNRVGIGVGFLLGGLCPFG